METRDMWRLCVLETSADFNPMNFQMAADKFATMITDKTVAELNRLVIYYQNLSSKVPDPEMVQFYRGAAAALNLFASWVEETK